MDPANVLGLCDHCDRLYTVTHPPLRRRKLGKVT
jgi:hypothetical protein